MTLALFQVQGTWVLCSRDMRRTEGISTNDCYDNDRKTRDLGIFGRLQRLLAIPPCERMPCMVIHGPIATNILNIYSASVCALTLVALTVDAVREKRTTCIQLDRWGKIGPKVTKVGAEEERDREPGSRDMSASCQLQAGSGCWT